MVAPEMVMRKTNGVVTLPLPRPPCTRSWIKPPQSESEDDSVEPPAREMVKELDV
jgi:hypothetical protein